MEEEKRKRKECLSPYSLSHVQSDLMDEEMDEVIERREAPIILSHNTLAEEIAEERRSDHKIYIPWLPSYTHITYPLSICFHIFILRFHELKG